VLTLYLDNGLASSLFDAALTMMPLARHLPHRHRTADRRNSAAQHEDADAAVGGGSSAFHRTARAW
jgi:hypothetical protein